MGRGGIVIGDKIYIKSGGLDYPISDFKLVDYGLKDSMMTWDLYQRISSNGDRGYNDMPKQVIHNGRTTVLVWEDKTKTIVKAMQGEKVDKQLGFLIAFFQKHSGLSKTKANEYLEQFIDNKERNCRTCKNLNSVPYKYPCCYCTSNQGFAYWEEI